jgi:signal transduction histidine kinase
MIPAGSEPTAGAPPGSGRPAGYPFRGPGLLVRVGPFAAIAVLAEASLALPPGPTSAWAAGVSVVLLVAVAAGFLLPWPRLPGWMPVLVPLVYTGSVLALILAAEATSGVGIVILVPLIWTALFGRLWESACVVAAIVAVEVVISLTPAAVPDVVIARRVILWAALGAVILVSTHGLRDRIRRAREQAALLQDRLRETSITEDRDRIAGDLRDQVIQQIFAAGLTLESAAMRTTDPDLRRRIDETIDDLDHAVLILRDTIYSLEHRLKDRGLRAEILRLCEELDLAPELSFSGPVDGALHPGDRARLLELLREAVPLIGPHFDPTCIEITASGDSCTTVVEARPLAGAAGIEPSSEFSVSGTKPPRPGSGLTSSRAGYDAVCVAPHGQGATVTDRTGG